ncbi:hypothetical protein [Algoriphagus limi]|uniref:Tripartite tricarboxylate transporter TctB family protein n=1 Tax=Algoriphagus limi TaxID=2975273 RepID=A0ABT2G6H4_9BACT|nr:hypothetical protein [Algoriphagus limi]MCS5490863.1 hypothetical protein [Algoriphagus limi]
MEKSLTSNESLAIITEMIAKAKRETVGDGGFQMLLWGWVVAICNFGHYALEKMNYGAPYVVWLLIIPATLVSFIKGYHLSKKAPAKSHLTRVINQLWIVIFVGMIIVLAFMGQLNFHQNPIILILAGIGVFGTGALVQEKIVRFGGVFLLVSAAVSFFLPVTDQYLLSGLAIVVGYLIPGYHIKKKSLERV